MRGGRVVSVAAVAAALAAAGCVAQHHDAANTTATTTASATSSTAPSTTATAAPQVHGRAPAPKDPDLGTVMERFYQQVEGEHWPFAYAMLSPRYRARFSQAELVDRYGGLVAPEVALRQLSDTTVVTHIDAHDRADSHARAARRRDGDARVGRRAVDDRRHHAPRTRRGRYALSSAPATRSTR